MKIFILMDEYTPLGDTRYSIDVASIHSSKFEFSSVCPFIRETTYFDSDRIGIENVFQLFVLFTISEKIQKVIRCQRFILYFEITYLF